MGRKTREYLSLSRPREYLRQGIGYGGKTLPEHMGMHPDVFNWDAVEMTIAGQGRVITVRKHSPYMDTPGTPEMELIVDPAKGYMATQFIWRDRDGTIRQLVETDFEEVEAGLFLASAMRIRRYDDVADRPRISTETIAAGGFDDSYGNLAPLFDKKFEYELVDLDYEADSTLFGWTGLGMDEGQVVIVTDELMRSESHLVMDGKLVPRSIARDLDVDQILNDFEVRLTEIDDLPESTVVDKTSNINAGTSENTSSALEEDEAPRGWSLGEGMLVFIGLAGVVGCLIVVRNRRRNRV